MENKYLKDFIIIVVVLLVIAFGWFDYYNYNKVEKIPHESKYKKLALSEKLLEQIQSIEESIKDRKN